MKKISALLLALLPIAAVYLGPTALAQTTEKDGLLRDVGGKTLYVFDKDAGGVSACYDACATNWPPFLAPPGAIEKNGLTLHARKDGQQQWGFGGKPLYYFIADAKAGDVAGDGKGGVWHVVKPGAAPVTPYSSAY